LAVHAIAPRCRYRFSGYQSLWPSERILHPLNRVPEKQLAGLGVLRSFSGLKTVLGEVRAQLNL